MSTRHAGARRRWTAVGAGALLGLSGLFAPAAMAATPAEATGAAGVADSAQQTASVSGASAATPSDASGPSEFGADASTYLSDATVAAATSEPTASHQHCAVSLAADGADGASGVTGQRCFTRFADAVAYGTGGDVRPRADARPAEFDMDAARVRASTLLSIMYDHRSYDGASKILMGTGRGCYAGRTYSIDDLSDVRFDNRANSVKMRANCLGRFYAGTNQRGDRFLCVGNCSSLGSMNNRATSTKFF